MSEQDKISARFGYKHSLLYFPLLAIALDSVQAGILLSQLLYWHDRATLPDDWVYKTVSDLYLETGLKRSGQETAIKKLVKMGILEVKLAQIPARRHFRIDVTKIHALLDRTLDSGKLDEVFPADFFDTS